jgi:methylthioxylose transferase
VAPSTSAPPTVVARATRPVRVADVAAERAAPTRRPDRADAGARAARAGVLAWAAVVVVAVVWGTVAVADAGVAIRAAPLMGHWRGHGGPAVAAAVLVAAGLIAAGPTLASRAPWRVVPWGAGVAAAGWATALAAADGWHRVTEPLTTRHEYEPFAAGTTDLGGFLAGFTHDLPTYPVHVQGHPPGPVVLAWALDRVGLGGAGWLAALALAGWGVAVAAALIAARAVAGERAARRAAPALALVPAAVWAGTSLDALFAGLTAGAAALAVLAVTRRSSRLAGAAGLAAGTALTFTYGAVIALAVPVLAGAALVAGDPRPLGGSRGAARPAALAAWAAGGAGAVIAVAAAAGFWWPDGLRATGAAYWGGVGGQRPAVFLTLVGNPAALALATGPAVAAGLAATLSRTRAAWRPALLPAAALAAVLVANLSQMSRGETERIWLPFVPWLALAAPGHRRGWLAAQAALALVLQTALDSPW